MKRISSICEKCIRLKEKGIDAFFTYSPHIDAFSIAVYEKGWNEDNIADYGMYAYIDKYSPLYDEERLIEIENKLDELLGR